MLIIIWLTTVYAGFVFEDTNHDRSWMQFRGPNGVGRSEYRESIPTKLNESSLVWKTTAPEGHSSPIVVDDHVYLTGAVEKTLITVCFDLRNGSEVWRREIEVSQVEPTHPQHGPASCTAVSDGQHVIATFGSFGTVAYDRNGKELWRRERPVHKNMFGAAASPIVHRDRLLLFHANEASCHLESIEIASGKLIWERKRDGAASSWATPCILNTPGGPQILIYEPYHLRACSWDGEDLWSVPNLADEPITIPQYGHGLVFTTSYNLRTNLEATGLPTFDTLLSECDANQDQQIDATEAKTNKSILSRPDADGQGDHPLRMFFRLLDENKDGQIARNEWPRIHTWMDPWKHANGLIAIRPGTADSPASLVWENAQGVAECPTPLVLGERIVMIRNGGLLTCIHAKAGNTLFQKRLPAGGPYYASPVAAGERLCLASARGQLTILELDESTAQILDTTSLGQGVYATPALCRHGLVVRSEQGLWRFDGKPR